MEKEIKVLIENDDGTEAPPQHIIEMLTFRQDTKTPETEAEEL